MRGAFVIERRGEEYWMVKDETFYFDGSPDPGFALSRNLPPTREEAEATRFHVLPGSRSLLPPQFEVGGPPEARIGADIDLSQVSAVFLWCFFNPFLLGVGLVATKEDAA